MDFIENIKQNRERILKGLINCIPLPFQRYKKYWLGIQKNNICLSHRIRRWVSQS